MKDPNMPYHVLYNFLFIAKPETETFDLCYAPFEYGCNILVSTV